MFIAPRPKVSDDPYFAIRLACAGSLALLIAFLIQSSMPMLIPALTIGLMAGMRKAFDLKKAIAGPLFLIIAISFFYWLISWLHVMPLITTLVVFFISTLAYYLTLKSGNPVGMLVLISVVLMSVMGAKSGAALMIIRNSFIEGAITAMILIPLLYHVFPSRATTPLEEVYQPDPYGQQLERAMLRAAVLLLLLVWLYTVLDTSNMTLAIAAIFTLIFPCKEHQFEEAKERSFATLLGGLAALLILTVIGYIGHFFMLLGCTLLAIFVLANQMYHGRYPPMVYQYSISVMLALMVGALTNNAPLPATLLRLVLTLSGTLGAVFLYALLESLLFKNHQFPASRSKNPD